MLGVETTFKVIHIYIYIRIFTYVYIYIFLGWTPHPVIATTRDMVVISGSPCSCAKLHILTEEL